ncbi:hypothetical protein HQ47_08535 [Porphyromonas macacae]|uniref:Uncharacterized protein n=1 Tax=Porphyromonas macacae TaxID=28115 RepID=A0A0A2E5M2_9PORP|nr:hypothetical protein HQ47_08535 [Porphyromonas macacae]
MIILKILQAELEKFLLEGFSFLAQWIFNEVNLDFYSLPEEFSTIRQRIFDKQVMAFNVSIKI